MHGDETEIRDLLHHEARVFEIFLHADRSSGGVVTLVRRDVLGYFDFPQSQSLVGGRVLRVSLLKDGCEVVLYNVHNFGLTPAQLHDVSSSLAHDVDAALACPHECSLLVGGDFNFLPTGEVPLSLATPTTIASCPAPAEAPLAPHQGLRAQLERLVEIQQSLPTHFCSANSSLSRLDRFYTSVPPWMLTLLKARCSLGFCAKWSHQAGLSDHALVQCTLSWVPQMAPELRPIQKFVFSLPSFELRHRQMCDAACLDDLSLLERWALHKDILREVARLVLAEHLVLAGHHGFGGSLTYTSIARAVWFSDTSLANTLIARSATARTHIRVEGSTVVLHDHAAFAHEIAVDKHSTFSQRIAAAEVDFGAQQTPTIKHNRVNALMRMARLWSPFDKRLMLHGIKCVREDGSFVVVTAPASKVEALRTGWAPTFAHKTTDTALASQILAQHSTKWEFADIQPPTMSDISNALRCAKHSAPGVDGLPYAAWQAAGQHGAKTIYLILQHLLKGLMMPMEFNLSLMVFVPKGGEPDESTVVREPCDTRPLSLKNTDNKVVCSVINHKMRLPLSTHACSIQGGFVPGRQLVANVVDLDAFGRIHGMQSTPHDPSLFTFFDFAAAFPSLSHQWIASCMIAVGLPSGAIDLILNMYCLNLALASAGTDLTPLFFILSGVLQGCPLSGFLYALGSDPFLVWVRKVVELSALGKV